MKRNEIINRIINAKGYKTYLEIGLASGSNFIMINAKEKTGVDPEIKNQISGGKVFQMTSDEFFDKNRYIVDAGDNGQVFYSKKFDTIFIDGLHHEEQVKKDIENALNALNDNGTIIVHDVNPTTEDMQIVPRVQKVWTGDVWKAWVTLRKTRDDIFQVCIDEDYGCGIITKGSQDLLKSKLSLTYANLNRNRAKLLNLITYSEYESNHLHS
jgi:hypothetical protein